MWFCEECKQRGVQKKDLENLDVLVASCGGVGTSFFMRFLNRFKKVNCVNNCDGFKHLVAPPPVAQRKFKAVYIYGNPIDATISLFIRNFQKYHARSVADVKDKPLIKDLNDLQRYALEGHDIFKFERHFNNWKKSTMSYPILFIKYEHIWDNLPEIFDFLDIPKSEIKHFPKNTGRESGIEQQPAEVQRALLAMYGSFAQEVEKEKPIFIKNASLPSRQRRRVNLLTRYYHDPSLERQKEIEQCILANCRNEFIEKIYLFVKEDLDIDHFKSDKIEKVILGRCMTFDDAIMLCNSSLGGELCIIANTDIYFDESLKLLHGVNFHNLVLALTRHDVLADGSIQEMKGFYFNGEFRKCSPAYSQDAWILHAPLINVMPNFLPGTLGCERKLAHEFLKQKYMVLNPFKLIKAYHLHNSALRRHASYSIIGSAASKLCPVNPTLDLPLLAHNQFSQIHNLSTLRTAVRTMLQEDTHIYKQII